MTRKYIITVKSVFQFVWYWEACKPPEYQTLSVGRLLRKRQRMSRSKVEWYYLLKFAGKTIAPVDLSELWADLERLYEGEVEAFILEI